MAAEWMVQDFYKQGVEYFTQSDFTKVGFPADSWERLKEIYEVCSPQRPLMNAPF